MSIPFLIFVPSFTKQKHSSMEKTEEERIPKPWLFGGLGVLLLLVLILVRVMFFNFVDSYELGYKFDKRTGELTRLHKTGYIFSPPFVVSVKHVDLRPVQVCINANQRVLNCKLVQFNPDGLELFLSWHGRKNYDISSISTTGDGSFTDILRSYAYSGADQHYPFLTIKKELKPESDTTSTVPKDTLR